MFKRGGNEKSHADGDRISKLFDSLRAVAIKDTSTGVKLLQVHMVYVMLVKICNAYIELKFPIIVVFRP